MKIALLAGLLAAAPPARADDGTTHNGASSTADFLRVGAGARAAGMGEAHAAFVDDATAMYWNPAALTRVEKRSAAFMHAQTAPSMSLEYAAYAHRLSEKGGTLGLSAQYMSYGTLQGADALGADTAPFKPRDLAVGLGYGFEIAEGALARTAFGAAVKFVESKIVRKASGVSADLGALSAPLLGDRLRLGVSGSNLGGSLKYDTRREELPTIVRAGAGLRLTPRWSVAADAVKEAERDLYANAGAETLLSPADGPWKAALRLGFSSRDWETRTGVEGVSAGVGLGLRGVWADYAFVLRPGDPGHRASLNLRF